MRNYCTLFDRAYLEKGLAMYESLRRHSSEDITLFVLPMDEECRWILDAMALPGIKLVNLEKFVSELDLGETRKTRTHAEWCWTCASQLCWHLMYGMLDEITYLDSDLYFFSDPESVFKEIGKRSIAITPHRLIPSKRYLEINGIFNVGWLTFRNNEHGMRCLAEWADDCKKWCYNRVEPMRFGDQKYLDAWPMRYSAEVCQLSIGVNVAPWNVGNWRVTEGPCVDGVPIVCYHAHEFKEQSGGFLLTNYELRAEDLEFIYGPYMDAYRAAKARIEQVALKLESERA